VKGYEKKFQSSAQEPNAETNLFQQTLSALSQPSGSQPFLVPGLHKFKQFRAPPYTVLGTALTDSDIKMNDKN
jgi:hypothetical protein